MTTALSHFPAYPGGPMNREAFEAWWDDFTSIHDDWMYADSEALRFQAWQAAVAHERKRCAGKLKIGEHTKEMLECDLALEHEALPELKEAIAYCEQIGDFVSRDLFQSILESEEEHIDWIETQLDLIARIGEQNYQQSMM